MGFSILGPRLAGTLICASLLLTKLSATTYTLVDLGVGIARDINSSGQVVGNAEAGGWLHDGTNRVTLKFGAHYLGAPADQLLFFTAISANSINDTGRIVGSILFIPQLPSTQTAYLLDPTGPAILLASGEGYGVNKPGAVVGGAGSGFLFDTVTVLDRPLATLNALNDSGFAVGSVPAGTLDQAAGFNGSTRTVLNLQGLNLPAPGPGHSYSSTALSVNNAGQIVGQVELTGSAPKPTWGFLHAQGAAISLGDLGGTTTSPHDINNGGTIVGTATTGEDSPHAFVYSAGEISDLNVLTVGAFGWVLTSANAINDSGFIVGEGTKNGVQHAFMLKPVTNSLPPAISIPPAGASVFTGDGFSVGVTASGTGPLTYQWRHAGTNLPGATHATYAVPHAAADDSGNYRVAITNPFGTTVSTDALIQVRDKVTGTASLGLSMFAGLTITGPIGLNLRLEAAEDAGNPVWQVIETLTLNASPYVWVDLSSTQHTHRIYRAVPLP
jgi:probable HAF family extracellular repeat protein